MMPVTRTQTRVRPVIRTAHCLSVADRGIQAKQKRGRKDERAKLCRYRNAHTPGPLRMPIPRDVDGEMRPNKRDETRKRARQFPQQTIRQRKALRLYCPLPRGPLTMARFILKSRPQKHFDVGRQ